MRHHPRSAPPRQPRIWLANIQRPTDDPPQLCFCEGRGDMRCTGCGTPLCTACFNAGEGACPPCLTAKVQGYTRLCQLWDQVAPQERQDLVEPNGEHGTGECCLLPEADEMAHARRSEGEQHQIGKTWDG